MNSFGLSLKYWEALCSITLDASFHIIFHLVCICKGHFRYMEIHKRYFILLASASTTKKRCVSINLYEVSHQTTIVYAKLVCETIYFLVVLISIFGNFETSWSLHNSSYNLLPCWRRKRGPFHICLQDKPMNCKQNGLGLDPEHLRV